MTLRRAGVAFAAAVALAMVFASSAFATATTKNSHWILTGSGLVSGETREAKCSKDGAENLVVRGTVLGLEVEVKATGLECVGGSVIKQEGEHAIATGKLEFTGVSVVKPSGCSTASTVTSNALTSRIYMEGTTTVYRRFEATAGESSALLSLTLTGCALEGSFPIKGTLFGLAATGTGVESVNQTLSFSAPIQTTAGGSLTLGGKAVTFIGNSNNELVSGSKFSTYENAFVACAEVNQGEGDYTSEADCTATRNEMPGKGNWNRAVQ